MRVSYLRIVYICIVTLPHSVGHWPRNLVLTNTSPVMATLVVFLAVSILPFCCLYSCVYLYMWLPCMYHDFITIGPVILTFYPEVGCSQAAGTDGDVLQW